MEDLALGVVRILAILGGIRMFLSLLAIAIAFLVLGHLAGRIIGAVLLVGVIFWAWRVARSIRHRDVST